jgi:uncharacterized protein DUF4154
MSVRPARWLFVWAALLVSNAAVPAQEPAALEASEAGVKAAYLYKFAAYVDWPESASAGSRAFVIGVMDADEVAQELERIVPGRSVHDRPVEVRRLREGHSTAGLHMLFVGRGADVRAALGGSQQPGLLVVTDNPRGLELGSTINFVLAGEHLGFEVSLEAAQHHGLSISSRMLNVARRVVPKA